MSSDALTTVHSLFQTPGDIWDETFTLHSSPLLHVVDKPAGLALQGAADDLVSRLRAHYHEPDLSPTHAFPRDSSGLVVLARTKAARAITPDNLEWTLVTHAWPQRLGKHGTLSHSLTRTRDDILIESQRGATECSLSYTVLAHAPEHVVVRVHNTHGLPHHIRAQMALVGAPILGDLRYGGRPHWRVMLACTQLQCRTPQGLVRVETTAPPSFTEWQTDWTHASVHALAQHIRSQAALRRPTLARNDTTMIRLMHLEGDGLAGATIDRYDAHALVQTYDEPAQRGAEKLADALMQLGAQGVHVKHRPKQSNTLVDTRRDDLAPRAPLRGTSAPDESRCLELGTHYLIRLTDGLSTGIFLDQRANREWVRAHAKDKRVLNLFAYTCAFSVVAALGGAQRVVSVDASQSVIEWGKRNFELNQLSLEPHLFVAADVFGWLDGAHARGDRFDLVIVDPPSYSTTRDGGRFSAHDDYTSLLTRVVRVLAPKGSLVCSTNHRKITQRRFLSQVERALETRSHTRVSPFADPIDFPSSPGLDSHLKAVHVSLTA